MAALPLCSTNQNFPKDGWWPPLPPARYAWPRLLLGYKPAAQQLLAMGMKAIPLPTIFIYIPFKGYSPSTPIIPFGYKIFKSAVMTLPQRKKGDCMKFYLHVFDTRHLKSRSFWHNRYFYLTHSILRGDFSSTEEN